MRQAAAVAVIRPPGPAPAVTELLVGVAGFEPTAFRSQSGRATKLRHTPLVRHVEYMPPHMWAAGIPPATFTGSTGYYAVCQNHRRCGRSSMVEP